MEEKEMEGYFEELKRESILFVSLVKPDTIFNISKIWGYESDTLYNVKQKAIEHKLITPLDSSDKVGEEKPLKTDMESLLKSLSNRSMVSEIEDEIKELYFNGKYLSEVLYVDTLKNLFLDRNILHDYYYDLMPVFLVFLPVCIKLYQYNHNMSSIGTMTIMISMELARRKGEHSKDKREMRHDLIYRGLWQLMEKFKDVELPQKTVSRLYKFVSRDEHFRAYPLEEEFMKHRLNKAKYKQFEI